MSLAKRFLKAEPVFPGLGEMKKFTVNVKSTGELSVTIRTDDKQEALSLLEELKAVVNPPRKKKPYLQAGDPCQSCDGYMTLQTGTNRKSGGTFEFLGCSRYPDCEFTAYLSKAEQTEGT